MSNNKEKKISLLSGVWEELLGLGHHHRVWDSDTTAGWC